MARQHLGVFLAAAALAAYVPLFAVSVEYSAENAERVLVNDVGRLTPTYVKDVVRNREIEGIQETLAMAREEGLKVSIAGKRHSMGGHAFYPDAVVLDMTSLDRILEVDSDAKRVTVQSGATWEAVIEAVNPADLSVAVMQAYTGFTVGGSLSVNVHESDPNYGPLIGTVDSFRLLLANGTLLDVSRERHPELFGLVIGGYGLFGVIVDATLRLTDNVVLAKEERLIDYASYPSFFRSLENRSQVGQVYARLSIAKDESLLRELYVTIYSLADQPLGPHRELRSEGVALKKFVFGLSRMFDWGKELRWYLQKEESDRVDPRVASRNNLMNADLSFLYYTSATDTDILQEYFLPVDALPAFVDRLRDVVRANDLNLLSATLRYVPVNAESFLSYSRNEAFGLVLYFNVGTSEKAQRTVERWTRELLDAAIEAGGTYYLPYVSYATPEQLRAAYPEADLFFAKKREFDPELRFMSRFYDAYGTSVPT